MSQRGRGGQRGAAAGERRRRLRQRRAAGLRRRNAITRSRPWVWLGSRPEDSPRDGEPNWGVAEGGRGSSSARVAVRNLCSWERGKRGLAGREASFPHRDAPMVVVRWQGAVGRRCGELPNAVAMVVVEKLGLLGFRATASATA
jgi:hypothetical protein